MIEEMHNMINKYNPLAKLIQTIKGITSLTVFILTGLAISNRALADQDIEIIGGNNAGNPKVA
jgi:thiosulfate reductase cytochrome b subunit